MSKMRDSTKMCLTFEERPGTPPELRKYRRSAYLEPGKRFQHPGVTDDYPKMHLDEKIFGISDKPTRDGAADLINHPKMSELQRMQLLKSEKTYKHVQREPLGHSPDRKIALPQKFTEGQQAFGAKSSSSVEPAKGLIFPKESYENPEGNDLYKRSHGSYAPGEQKRRGYNWSVDPAQTRFGAKGDTIALNGVSKNIKDVLTDSSTVEASSVVNLKKVEDFRNMGNMLGQTRNLGQESGSRPRDMVYGKPSGAKTVSAADVIKGKYTVAELQPDRDLGKSILPGFRNLTVEDRVYGCPSIRNDIPALPYSKRSLADSQNYGDDVPAQDLINPPAFSDLSIGPLVMDELRPKDKVLDLFSRIGFHLDDRVREQIFYQASQGSEFCTVNAFRNALNDYVIRQDLVMTRK